MKTLAVLTLTALIAAPAVYASSNPSSAAANAPAAANAAPAKTKEACGKEAKEKHLTGKAHDDYVKECIAGKHN
jgi:hypothetical protein